MSLLNQARVYQKTYASSVVDPSFKVDKDYSEETRSQDDADTVMRLGIAISAPTMTGGPEGIIALSEAERSGMHINF